MFNSTFENKKVLITGNTGFKGAWLSIWLEQLGAEVYGISNGVLTNPSLFEAAKLSTKINYRELDIRDLPSLSSVVTEINPDFVFHLAAQALVFEAYDDPISTLATNVMGTANVLESLRSAQHECIAVIITSDKCYENAEWVWGYRENDRLGGKDPYSASKACAELVIHSYYKSYFSDSDCPIKLVSARAGNVIGGGDWSINRIIPDCIKAWTHNKPVDIRRPNATRPWQHVLEPLSGYLRAAQVLSQKPELNGKSFNLGPPADQNYSVLQLLQEIGCHWFEGNETFNPVNISAEDIRSEAGLLKLSCDSALACLDWKSAINFKQTARFTAEWYKKYYNSQKVSMTDFSRHQIDEYCEIAKKRLIDWAVA